MYLQRVLFHPQPGKETELQHHLEAQIKKSQALGMKIGLATLLFSPEGTTFVITIRFDNLAEFEKVRQRNSTDQAFQEFLTKGASLSHRPRRLELLEVLVPMPS